MTEGDGVNEFETGACGHSGGQAGDFYPEGGEFFGQIDGGGFPAGIRAKTEDDLLHFTCLGALEKGGNF